MSANRSRRCRDQSSTGRTGLLGIGPAQLSVAVEPSFEAGKATADIRNVCREVVHALPQGGVLSPWEHRECDRHGDVDSGEGEELIHTCTVAPSRIAVLLATGLALGGGALAPAAFAGAQDAARDALLAVRVKTALVNDVELGTMPIDVVARGGAVTL